MGEQVRATGCQIEAMQGMWSHREQVGAIEKQVGGMGSRWESQRTAEMHCWCDPWLLATVPGTC